MKGVVICVATYRRPDMVDALLEALADLDTAPEPVLRIVVVDNAPEASTATALRDRWRTLPLTVLHEPRPGISHARNAAVAAALDIGPRFVAMLDDDEQPVSGWLRHLVAVQAATGADAVCGPVHSTFDHPPPSWLGDAGYFVPRPAMTRLADLQTNNLLIRADTLRQVIARDGHVFDPRLALIGGEDTDLGMRLQRAGHRGAWAPQAVVTEHTPPERLTLSWAARRAFRGAATWALLERRTYGTSRLGRLVKGTGRVLQGGAQAFAGAVTRDTGRRCRGLVVLSGGLGACAGACGLVLDEYARPAASDGPPLRRWAFPLRRARLS